MSTSLFTVQEHIISAQHIREYPGATSGSQEEELKLHVKQYTPLDTVNVSTDAITFIAAHANGFVKVLMAHILEKCTSADIRKGAL